MSADEIAALGGLSAVGIPVPGGCQSKGSGVSIPGTLLQTVGADFADQE
ncbi:MAG: hypothetical protein M2R45_02747 [Verrucomicrobia subdivision 3 bacterium]|nr:hypothetical protein [Limisphaerales bacterium]MCS1414297.1 hypothetical protein [Limisphaerales bacterium]